MIPPKRDQLNKPCGHKCTVLSEWASTATLANTRANHFISFPLVQLRTCTLSSDHAFLPVT